MAKEKVELQKLNKKQEAFCRFYTSFTEGTFGNATKSYKKVFPKIKDASARVLSARLLAKVNILHRIEELLEDHKENDRFVDSRLYHWISQNKEPNASVSAIKEYNRVKGRVQDKIDVTSKGKAIKTVNLIDYSKAIKDESNK